MSDNVEKRFETDIYIYIYIYIYICVYIILSSYLRYFFDACGVGCVFLIEFDRLYLAICVWEIQRDRPMVLVRC